jgi:AraC-like DNA-binding protein
MPTRGATAGQVPRHDVVAAGTPPYHHFLKRLRLERARDLLLSGDFIVSDVAGQVAYTSLSHFSSEFKKYFGHSPVSHLQRLHRVGRPGARTH